MLLGAREHPRQLQGFGRKRAEKARTVSLVAAPTK